MAVDFYSYNDHHHRDHHHEEEEEDEYIDMEVTSYSDFYCHHSNKPSSSSLDPPHEYDPRGDFEFQMSFNSNEERDLTTASSPADELFYNGKLLPLYLPPRLQMVENLLTSALTFPSSHPFQTKTTTFEETYCTPSNTNTANTPIHEATPFESCNVSPAASCQVSKELNIEEYLAEYACNDDHEERIDDDNDQLMNNSHEDDKVYSTAMATASVGKKSWTRKLKLIKPSSTIGSKLKASRSYLKSLFGGKSGGCSYESSPAAGAGVVAKSSKDIMIGGEFSSSGRVHQDLNKGNKKYPFRRTTQQISTNLDQEDNNNEDRVGKDGKIKHRRSFSGAFTRRSAASNKLSMSSSSSSSSSSLSNNNNSNDQLPVFRRSSSASNSEFESPIQGAIAHCKRSQAQKKQVLIRPRKTMSEVGFCSFASSSRSELTCD